MQTKLTNSPTPAKLSLRDQGIITCLSLGPMLIAITIAHVHTERRLLDVIVSLFPFVGAICLNYGLMALYTRQTRILARLDTLEKR